MAWQDYNPGNSSNPLDQAGNMHNEGLDHFINNVDSLSLSQVPFNGHDLFSVLKLMAEFYSNNYFEVVDSVTKALCFQSNAVGSLSNYNNGTPNPYPNRDDMFSQALNSFIDDINNEVEGLTENNIGNFTDSVKTIESNIGVDYTLNDLEKRIAFGIGSIARYSGAYWGDEYKKYKNDSSGSSWAQKNSQLGGKGWDDDINKPPDWVYADGKSFFVSSYVGAAAGVLTGGTALAVVAGGAAVSSGLKALT